MRIMGEDFLDVRDLRQMRQSAGKLSGGYELEHIRRGWVKHAMSRAAETPTVGAKTLAHEIHRDQNLNPTEKAVGTINNYLGATRTEWDPKRR